MGYLGRRGRLLLLATALALLPAPERAQAQNTQLFGPGVISGVIWWNKADATSSGATPATMCSPLSSAIWVSTPKIKLPNGELSTIGSLNVTPAAVDLGRQWECMYTVRNLPVGVPIQVAIAGDCVEAYSSSMLWNDPQNNSVAPVGRPVGWDGSITVLPPPPAKSSTGTPGGPAGVNPVHLPPPGGGSGSSSGPFPIHMPGGVRFRHNPTAVGTVSDIDFSLTFGPAPYGLQAPPVNLFGTCFPPKQ